MTIDRRRLRFDQRFQIAELGVGTLQLGEDHVVLAGRDFFAFQQKIEFAGEHQRQAVDVGINQAFEAHLEILRHQPLLAPPSAVATDESDA